MYSSDSKYATERERCLFHLVYAMREYRKGSFRRGASISSGEEGLLQNAILGLWALSNIQQWQAFTGNPAP